MTETTADKWLPAISFSSSTPRSQPLLLLSPGLSFNNNCDSTLALTCWFSFFGHKYPFLLLHDTPLHAYPRYPDPFTSHSFVTMNIADEVQETHISGYESVEILISWIGRAVRASTTQEDEVITKMLASTALTAMVGIRANLCNAVNRLMHAKLTSSVIIPLRAFDIASEFLEHVLVSLKELCADKCHSPSKI